MNYEGIEKKRTKYTSPLPNRANTINFPPVFHFSVRYLTKTHGPLFIVFTFPIIAKLLWGHRLPLTDKFLRILGSHLADARNMRG